MFASSIYPADPAARCEAIYAQACALVEGETHLLANLSNIAALLYDALNDVNWAGFYLLDGDELVLGPFCGKPACLRIAPGRGVCGSAFKEGQPLLVEDVHAFPGHIACDSASRSELVVPLRMGKYIIGVIDLDSPVPARFTLLEQRLIERIAALLENACAPRAGYTLAQPQEESMCGQVNRFIQAHRLECGVNARYIDVTSEIGELGKELLKASEYGSSPYRPSEEARMEMGDCLFALLALCREMQIDAQQALHCAIKKYEDRFERKGSISSGKA